MTAPSSPSAASRRGPGPGCLAALAIAGGLAFLVGRSLFRSPTVPAPTAGEAPGDTRPTPHLAAAAALLDLRVGDRVGEATVVGVYEFVDRQLPLALEGGGARFWVFLALKGTQKPMPPTETTRYAIFHNAPASANRAVVDGALAEVARRLTEREASVAPPRELE